MAHARVERPSDAPIDEADDILGPSILLELRELHDAQLVVIDRWLGGLDEVRAASRRHVAADLADLYAGSERMRRLVDALLDTPPGERERAADTVVDLKVELQHLAWHIRSVTRRLERLADDLYGDDEPRAVEGDGP